METKDGRCVPSKRECYSGGHVGIGCLNHHTDWGGARGHQLHISGICRHNYVCVLCGDFVVCKMDICAHTCI